MRLTVFAAAVALVGFAGAANASATIDLIWADTGTDTISNVNTSSAITLQVILTAGPNGSIGAGVSVDYSEALGTLTVIGFAATPGDALPIGLGTTTDTGTRIEQIISVALGAGLAAGQSHQLGTVTFHKSVLLNGTFEIRSDANGPTDGVLDFDGNDITATTTFNSAFLTNNSEFPTDVDVLEPDFDGDGVIDTLDNCSERANPAQDDTDLDDCGNLCGADYDQSGRVDFADFGACTGTGFGTFSPLYQHYEPIGGRQVNFGDFGFCTGNFGTVPGPSGTTAGTIACP